MAQYKVIQDIEAEDKLLGPLTLRQFIYSAIVISILYAGFVIAKTPVWFIDFLLVPPLIFFGLLAAPFGHEQSSEIWLLGKVRYMIFSKKRVWDQEGIEHLVTITVPPKVETHYSDGLSNSDVKSRLKTLAATMDTRGWVVKNQTSSGYTAGSTRYGESGERLLEIQENPNEEMLSIKPSSDVLDSSASSNPVAADLSEKVAASEQQRRRQLLERMQKLSEDQKSREQSAEPTNYTPPPPIIVSPSKSPLEDERPSTPAKVILKNPSKTEVSPKQTIINNPPPKPVTQPLDADIINSVNKRKLSTDDDSQSVNTESSSDESGEVVISLH